MLAASLALVLAAAPVFDAPFFVHADVLNLRSSPGDGPIVARLRINTPARFVDERGAFLKIAVGPEDRPLTGWIPADLVGDDPLTDDVVRRNVGLAVDAGDADDEIRWRQRLVALGGTDEARWVELQDSLRAAGQQTEAVDRVLAGTAPMLIAEWNGSVATLLAVVHPGQPTQMTFGHEDNAGHEVDAGEPNLKDLAKLARWAQGSSWYSVTSSGTPYALGGTPVLRANAHGTDVGAVGFAALNSVQMEMAETWNGTEPRLITTSPIALLRGEQLGLVELGRALREAKADLKDWAGPTSQTALVRTQALGPRTLLQASPDPERAWNNAWWLIDSNSGKRADVGEGAAAPRGTSHGVLTLIGSAFKVGFGERQQAYAVFRTSTEGCEATYEVEPGVFADGSCGGEAGLTLFDLRPSSVDVASVTLSSSGC